MSHSIRPTSRGGWWTFWLGLAAAVWGALFPTLVRLLATTIRNAGIEPVIRVPVGMTSILLQVVLAIVALAVGLIALRRGERSWLAFLGFALALLFGGFWILFGLAELLFPH